MISVCSPAKLNLFLSVLNQRQDGYHNIETAFALLDWGDRLCFAPSVDLHIDVTGCASIAPETNLVVRAARLLQNACGVQKGVTIQVHKRIFMGAGLGGGSSNAAMTLLTLNRLWRTNLPLSELCVLGRALGADVGFFLHQTPYALGSGIGDDIMPVRAPNLWHLILLNRAHSSSSALYTDPRLARRVHAPHACRKMQQQGRISLSHIAKLENDFAPILANNPQITNALALLSCLPKSLQQAMVLPPRITGSGSSVFASFSTPFTARRAYSYLRTRPLNGTITPLLARTVPMLRHRLHKEDYWGVAKR